MPLFAHPTGVPSENAELASHDLQTWLDFLGREEYALLEEELATEPTAGERPMVSRVNAVIDRPKTLHASPEGEAAWSLVVKSRL